MFLHSPGRTFLEEAVNNLSGFLNTENTTWALRGVNLVTLDLNLWKRHEIPNLYKAATLIVRKREHMDDTGHNFRYFPYHNERRSQL